MRHRPVFRTSAFIAVWAILASGCGSSREALESPASKPSTDETFVSCVPVPRFRLGDIEYENQRFDDRVALADVGEVVGEVRVLPAEIERCERVVLKDGEGSLPVGTKIYAIDGIDQAVALTASLGNDVYLKYIGRPFPDRPHILPMSGAGGQRCPVRRSAVWGRRCGRRRGGG